MSPSRSKKRDPTPKKKQEEEEEEPREKKMVRFFLQSSKAPPLNCIEVDISSLKKSFLKVKEASDALSEVQILPKKAGVASTSDNLANPTWKFWSCCLCEDRFLDTESHLQHVIENHMRCLPECIKSSQVFPEDLAKELKEACWKPIDVDDGIAESKDEQRTELLEQIGKHFKKLVEKEMLDITHLGSLLNYAMAEAGELKSLLDRDFTLFFRCLGGQELAIVRDFLISLCKQCEISLDDKSNSPDFDDDGQFHDPPGEELLWMVNLDQSFSRMFLNASNPLGVEEVVTWLYGGCSFTRSLKSWTESRNARRDQGVEIVKFLNEKLECLHNDYNLIQSKCRSYDAYDNLLKKCTQESSRRENDSPILRAFLNGLEEHPTEIYTVLRRAEDMKFPESVFDAEDDMRILFALMHLKGWLHFENRVICKREISRLGTASCFDHLTVLMPILKCFLKNQWEEEAKKEEKSRKIFLKKEHKANLDEIDALVKHIENKS